MTIDRMKVLSSETAIKYTQKDIVSTQKQMKKPGYLLANDSENQVDIELLLHYTKYLLKHLSELLLYPCNPLREIAFLGVLFNEMPTCADLELKLTKKARYQG